MITIKKGNIFTTECQTIVNTVNCVGVMGAGIAFEFKLRYPEMFTAYEKHCNNGQVKLGLLWIYNEPRQSQACHKILNFPTKQHWKDPSDIHYIELGLKKFISTYQQKGITSIAFPLLGASLGGLSEDVINDLMEKYLSQVNIPVEIWYFDIRAKDDLYDVINSKFESYNDNELKALSGLGPAATRKIRSALAENTINSVATLLSVKGIGKASMAKLILFIKKTEHRNVPANLMLI